MSNSKDFDPFLFKLIDDFVYLPSTSSTLTKEMEAAESNFIFELIEDYVLPENPETEWVAVPSEEQVSISQNVQSMLETPFDRNKWRSTVISGIPEDMRGEVWCRLISPKNLQLKEKYIQLLSEKGEPKVNFEIENDVKRTFNFIPKFAEKHHDRLSNVLKTYSRFDREVGYCQGMSHVAGALLLYISDEAIAFCLLVDFMEKFGWRKLYLKGMPKLIELVGILGTTIKKKLPKLSEHLEENEINLYGVFSHFFLTIFTYATPIELGIRVLDIFLIEGEKVLIECTINIIELMKDKIMERTNMEVHEYIRKTMVEECYNKYGLNTIVGLLK